MDRAAARKGFVHGSPWGRILSVGRRRSGDPNPKVLGSECGRERPLGASERCRFSRAGTPRRSWAGALAAGHSSTACSGGSERRRGEKAPGPGCRAGRRREGCAGTRRPRIGHKTEAVLKRFAITGLARYARLSARRHRLPARVAKSNCRNAPRAGLVGLRPGGAKRLADPAQGARSPGGREVLDQEVRGRLGAPEQGAVYRAGTATDARPAAAYPEISAAGSVASCRKPRPGARGGEDPASRDEGLLEREASPVRRVQGGERVRHPAFSRA